MIFSSLAPQFGHICMPMSKTRLSSRAQLMRCGRAWTDSTSHSAPAAACACTGGPYGTTKGLSFAFGASTPWNLIRCSRGRGTSAASRWRRCRCSGSVASLERRTISACCNCCSKCPFATAPGAPYARYASWTRRKGEEVIDTADDRHHFATLETYAHDVELPAGR